MADFTLAQIQGEQMGPPAGGGQRPVSPPSPSPVASAINLFGQLMPTAQQMQQRAKARQEREAAGFVEQFSQTQLRIAEAVDMGQMSSQEARMRMRQAYSQAISNNPMLADEITSAHKNIIGTSGLGKVVAEGTEQEQRHQALLSSATQAGWVQTWMSAAEADEAALNWQRFNQAADDLSMRQAQLTFRRGQVGLQADVQSLETGRITQERARIELANARDARQAQNDLGIMADAYYPKFRSDVQRIQDLVRTGEMTPQEGIMEMETAMADIRQVVGSVGAHAGSAFIENMTAGFQRTFDLGSRVITGELDRDVYETQLDREMAKLQLIITGEPDTAAVVATSRLFQGSLTETLLGVDASRAVTGAIDRLTNEARKVPDPTDEDAPLALRMLRENMREDRVENPLADQEYHEQVNRGVNRVLQGVNAYSSAIENPAELNDVADFIASEDFRQYMQQDNVTISAEAAAGARQVLQQQYEQEVIPLVQEAWRDAQVDVGVLRGSGVLGVTGERAQVAEQITPTFAGGGLSFRTTSDNPRVQAKVRDLNRQVSPVVNRLIRMGAHLERHDNYEAIYRELYEPLFSREEAGDD